MSELNRGPKNSLGAFKSEDWDCPGRRRFVKRTTNRFNRTQGKVLTQEGMVSAAHFAHDDAKAASDARVEAKIAKARGDDFETALKVTRLLRGGYKKALERLTYPERVQSLCYWAYYVLLARLENHTS